MLSSHSIVSSTETVRPCSPWGGRWIGHSKTTWSAVCSSAPHWQATEGAIPHLCKQERKRPIPVRRRLSRTQALLGRVIPGRCVPVSKMESRSVLQPLRIICDPPRAQHSWCCYQMSCCATGTNGCLDFRQAPCVYTRWVGERWVEQMSRLHGTACWRQCGSAG